MMSAKHFGSRDFGEREACFVESHEQRMNQTQTTSKSCLPRTSRIKYLVDCRKSTASDNCGNAFETSILHKKY